jgi:hypothetical protein
MARIRLAEAHEREPDVAEMISNIEEMTGDSTATQEGRKMCHAHARAGIRGGGLR